MRSLRSIFIAVLLLCGLAVTPAQARTFQSGSLIIPMDVVYQNYGMFSAYGLVYELLRHDVPVHWVIKKGKFFGDADFTADAVDFLDSQEVIVAHAYRGGPWVVDSTDVTDDVKKLVSDWLTTFAADKMKVHIATADFEADVSRRLVVAPTIAMHADGNQSIARKYMVAARIPDSTLDPSWPDTSPDMLTPAEIAGKVGVERDGALFSNGRPKYCQLMTMHWGVGEAEKNPEVVAEVGEFLTFPTHFFAECQAVNAFENIGKFLTPNGFVIGKEQSTVKFVNADSPFAQIDGIQIDVDGIGSWDYLKGGSEPSYNLPQGDDYLAGGITMITQSTTPEGIGDVWMTGFLKGICSPTDDVCGYLGKVSYLGGHEYDVKVPIADNPKSQGTRLFLNSLFEAPCATDGGQPSFTFTKEVLELTAEGQLTYRITVKNTGLSTATDVTVRDPLDPGVTFVSATAPGKLESTEVVWRLGSVAGGDSFSLDLVVTVNGEGKVDNQAFLDYKVGLNSRDLQTSVVSTVYCKPGSVPSGNVCVAAPDVDNGDVDNDGTDATLADLESDTAVDGGGDDLLDDAPNSDLAGPDGVSDDLSQGDDGVAGDLSQGDDGVAGDLSPSDDGALGDLSPSDDGSGLDAGTSDSTSTTDGSTSDTVGTGDTTGTGLADTSGSGASSKKGCGCRTLGASSADDLFATGPLFLVAVLLLWGWRRRRLPLGSPVID